MPQAAPGPYRGYDSLEAAIDALRRARFRIIRAHDLAKLGTVVEGEIVEGSLRAGMVLLPVHRQHANIVVELVIQSVEFLLHSGGTENVALMLGTSNAIQGVDLADGNVVDVLEVSAST
jgi:hypothetical protein